MQHIILYGWLRYPLQVGLCGAVRAREKGEDGSNYLINESQQGFIKQPLVLHLQWTLCSGQCIVECAAHSV